MQRIVPWSAVLSVIGCLIAADASAQVVKQDVAGIRNFAKVESTVACAGAITAGAIPEICHDAALYAAVDDPDEWAGAISAIARHDILRTAKVAAGRARAGQFTWARAGQRLLDMAMTLADTER